MNTPIIVYENGDLSLYHSICEAERAMEPVDIENEEYIVYGPEGELFKPFIKKKKIGSSIKRAVVLDFAHNNPKNPKELRKIIIDFLVRSELADQDELAALSLELLIQLAIERLGYSP